MEKMAMADYTPSYAPPGVVVVVVGRGLALGATTLEESLALWERGEKLARTCQEWLDGARKKLDAALETDD